MNTYTLEAVIGVDVEGTPIHETFNIQANNWNEARHKLDELVATAQENQTPPQDRQGTVGRLLPDTTDRYPVVQSEHYNNNNNALCHRR